MRPNDLFSSIRFRMLARRSSRVGVLLPAYAEFTDAESKHVSSGTCIVNNSLYCRMGECNVTIANPFGLQRLRINFKLALKFFQHAWLGAAIVRIHDHAVANAAVNRIIYHSFTRSVFIHILSCIISYSYVTALVTIQAKFPKRLKSAFPFSHLHVLHVLHGYPLCALCHSASLR